MKKSAFTLAETMITVAILGVLATLTITNLSTNINVRELQTRFNKTVLDLDTFAKTFLLENNVSIPLYTNKNSSATLFKEAQRYFINSTQTSDWVWTSNNSKTMVYKYKSFKDSFGANMTSSICDATGKFMDVNGRIFSFDDAPKRGLNGPRVCVDINGVKGPNTYGIDVFSFLFTTDGSVVAEGEYHKNNNVTEKNYDSDKSVGYAWQSGTSYGAEHCYDHHYGQTCAYYASINKSPKDETKSYWKDFIGKKQYLK